MRRWRQWAAFAEFHDVDDLKARPDHVAAFVVARLDAGVSVATLGANLSAIRWVHKQVVNDVEVAATARRVLRVLSDRTPNDSSQIPVPAATLSVGAIEAMVRWSPPGDRLFSTRVIRLVTGSKPRHLLAASISDIRFHQDGRSVTLTLPTGLVHLERGRHPLECPVRALRSLVASSTDGDVFTELQLYGASPKGFNPLAAEGNEPVRIGIRDQAIILTGYAGALRTAELARLRVEDLTVEQQGYRLKIARAKGARSGESQYVRVERTGDHLDPVQALDDWIATRGDHDGTLFSPIGHTAQKRFDHDDGMHATTIRSIIVARANAVGLDNGPSGHSLRRSWATHQWLRDPHSFGVIAGKLRHAQLETTMRYIERISLDPAVNREDLLDPVKILAVSEPKPDMRLTLGFSETPLSELLETVEAVKTASHQKPSARADQAVGWRWWCRFAIEHDVSIMPADPVHVAAFIGQRADSGKSPSTLSNNLAAIRSAHAYYEMIPPDGFKLAREVIAGHRRITAGDAEPDPVLTEDQIQYLARRLSRPGRSLELAVVALGYSGALRPRDVDDLRIEDVRPTEEGRVSAVRGPSGNAKSARVLALRREDKLDPVAAFSAQAGYRTKGPLFPWSRDVMNRPMSQESIRNRLKRQCANAGIEQRVTLLSLRKAWATHAYENGLDVLTITRHLRHGENSSTMESIRKLSPWIDSPVQLLADTFDPSRERDRS